MIALIDYGAGNLGSVANALRKIKQHFVIARTPRDLEQADKVILPGVGAAGSCMEKLREGGFANILPTLKKPFLGVCIGLQVLAEFSEEDDAECLGIIPGKVRKFPLSSLKVPQIGWNRVHIEKKSPLFKGISDDSYFYFVNSFYFDAPAQNVLGRTNYGVSFPSVIQRDNFYAVQFHAEKSADTGLRLLKNFCTLC